MFDELREIDTAAIDELVKIKEEQELLEQRLARMEEEKDQVSSVVYERVKKDYEARGQELDDQARPLKEQARVEYGKLRSLAGRLQEALDAVRLEKEELEFRHRLGEFGDDDFQERLGTSEKQIETHAGELAEVEELRERFVAAVRCEEELEPGSEPQEAEPPEPPQPEATVEVEMPEQPPELLPPVPLDDLDDLEAGEAESPEMESPETESPETDVPPDVDATEVAESAAAEDIDTEDVDTEDVDTEDVDTEDVDNEDARPEGMSVEDLEATMPAVTRTLSAPLPKPTEAAPEAPQADTTVLLRGPRLVINRGDGEEEFRLGVQPITIGRAMKNEIRFLSTSVSRQHARVALGGEGYVVSDLGSGNGTLVNGEPVAGERRLREGDIIQVGSESLVFKQG